LPALTPVIVPPPSAPLKSPAVSEPGATFAPVTEFGFSCLVPTLFFGSFRAA
jgi:hypothetical protein